MRILASLKKLSIFLVILFSVTYILFACSANKTSTESEQKVTESQINANKSDAIKEPKEIKVSKPNEGGLKQELSTKASLSTTAKNQVTFEIPTNQLQGLKVGDSLVINSGNNSYPAQILNIPVNNIPENPTNVIGNPNTATKIIITAQVGPGINLPGNQRDYSVTYLYNNRDPHSYYINKNYVYYDDDRPFIYITGPDRVVRRKYIRVGLINRYYAELFDQFDAAERIVEAYKDYYIENVVVPQIIEDYTNQAINEYTDYIDSLNQRWNYDNDVNTFTVDVNDVDWNKLEEQDTILNNQDLLEIYEDVQTNSRDDNDPNNYTSDNDSNDSDLTDRSSIESASDDRDSNDSSSIESASEDSDSNDNSSNNSDSNDNTSYDNSSNDNYSNDNSSNDSDSNDYTSNDNTSYDNTSNDNTSYDNSSNDNTSYDNFSNDSYSNDNNDSYDNSSNNDSGGDDSSDSSYETTTYSVDDN